MIYVIINSSDVSSVNFSQVKQTSAETMRYNSNGTKAIVKFEGDTPSFLSGKSQYSHSEIISILHDKNGEWYYTEEYE
jgi:hypothetical protein